MSVLDRLGTLHAAVTDSGLRLAGDCDFTNYEDLIAALRRARRRSPARLVLDLTELSFLDAHGAGAILRLATAMSGNERLEVRCTRYHARVLGLLGARSVPGLVLTEERGD